MTENEIKSSEQLLSALEFPEYGVSLYILDSKPNPEYYFFKDNKLLFSGNEPFPYYSTHAVESMQTATHILFWMCLAPKDTDKEYFNEYNDNQLQWATSTECERLRAFISLYENGEDLHCKEATSYFTKHFHQYAKDKEYPCSEKGEST